MTFNPLYVMYGLEMRGTVIVVEVFFLVLFLLWMAVDRWMNVHLLRREVFLPAWPCGKIEQEAETVFPKGTL